jgi:hypothetical protein
MKKKIRLLICLLITGIGISGLKAQSLVITMKNGTEYFRGLSSLQNFTFSDGNLLLKYYSGSTESYGLLTIHKLYFSSLSTGIENAELNGKIISFYPNPVEQLIYLKNIPEGTSPVFIYRIDGVLIQYTQVISGGNPIDVSHLVKGFYFLKIKNQTFKFIKL